jgi:hypothetical protein
MDVFLDDRLARHRRGRFLATQLDARVAEATQPEAGIRLMIGKDVQCLAEAERQALIEWCQGPGRTLLLLPPYQEGLLLPALDWTIGFRETPAPPNGARLPDRLATETTYRLDGRDGDSDASAGHRWPDHSVNTRYLKAHSGSGVLAATCLPLWSITLQDEAESTLDWLRALHRQAGAAGAPTRRSRSAGAEPSLTAEALGLMVCLYGWQSADIDSLLRTIEAQPVPMFRLDRARASAMLARLSDLGYSDAGGLSMVGEKRLRESTYWGFAQCLRQEVRT